MVRPSRRRPDNITGKMESNIVQASEADVAVEAAAHLKVFGTYELEEFFIVEVWVGVRVLLFLLGVGFHRT